MNDLLETMKQINQKPIDRSASTLYVDLDGTIVATDTLWESLMVLLKSNPSAFLRLPFWLLRGKAFLKRRVSRHVDLNPCRMPYNEEVLSFMRSERQSGKEIVLATAADRKIAQAFSDHLGIFSGVLASDGSVNLSKENKLRAIKNHNGRHGFEYVGNDFADLPVWKEALRAHLVRPSRHLLSSAKKVAAVGKVFNSSEKKMMALLKAMRPYQWVKNLLLFVPLVLAHKVDNLELVLKAFVAFVIFSLCASCFYILNDLLDLEADRQHPNKRFRPFASGTLSIKTGLMLAFSLGVTVFAISLFFLSVPFTIMLGIYGLLTTAYSICIKKIPVLDVLILAGLYTHRILAGGIAVDVPISAWLLGFSIFFFLSLAFVKRYTELRLLLLNNKKEAEGRGYIVEDARIIQTLGPTSGYLSVLVLALYINSPEVIFLYKNPWVLWLLGPCLLYWVTRVWLLAHRDQMKDDPIFFAIKDKISYVVGVLIAAILIAATF
ncbi:MAG: UbiA family prenyltransferase [Candidatus Aminicenantes bacterium]|nr:UbiA family prenyltransferase [Candidatus Aminicenantes bacterium]